MKIFLHVCHRLLLKYCYNIWRIFICIKNTLCTFYPTLMWFAGVSSPGEGNQLEVLPTRLSLSLRGAQPKTPDIHPPPFKPRGNYKKMYEIS